MRRANAVAHSTLVRDRQFRQTGNVILIKTPQRRKSPHESRHTHTHTSTDRQLNNFHGIPFPYVLEETILEGAPRKRIVC